MPIQSHKDKWFIRGKDIILLFLGAGGIVTLVHIWDLPGKFEKMCDKINIDEASASQIDKRVSLVELNIVNQTELLKDIKSSQSKMWEKISNG